MLAIAHALETHKTITGDDIDAIFRGTPGPTLDGWVYHTDDFLLSYEAYHLSTIEAHQTPGQAQPRAAARHGHPGPSAAATGGRRPTRASRVDRQK